MPGLSSSTMLTSQTTHIERDKGGVGTKCIRDHPGMESVLENQVSVDVIGLWIS